MKTPGEGNGFLFLPGELRDRGAWQVTNPWDREESDTIERLTSLSFLQIYFQFPPIFYQLVVARSSVSL